MSDAPPGVALLDADQDFCHGLAGDELLRARRLVVVPRIDLEPGPWVPPAEPPGGQPVAGIVVLEGLVMREARLGGRASVQILGPGDVIDPWTAADAALPCTVRWSVPGEVARLGVLDARFALAARHWPSLAAVVHRKLCDRADRLAAHAAALQLRSVEARILGVFWQLAASFGRVRADGVVVRLRLTHQLIGQLVGAQRPTVSLALKRLAAAGHLARTEGGGWLLADGSRELLAPAA